MAKKEAHEPANDSPVAVDPPKPDPDERTAEVDPGAAEALQRERDDYYDRLLRKSAEFDNYRKRVERERREHGDRSVGDVLLDVLNVVDDFELALDAEAPTDVEGVESYRKGVELIHAKLLDLLKKRGVRRIEALGTDFDPNLHQAVTHESSPEHREGEVIGELRRGYMLGDRLLRPAMVKVAKA